MITLDSSGLVTLVNTRDPNYNRCRSVLNTNRSPFLIPVGILSEATYMMQTRLGPRAVDALFESILRTEFKLDCGETDIPRIRRLVHRYADMPLDYADAAVIACAERNGGRVLTLDLRHFGIVAREGTIAILP